MAEALTEEQTTLVNQKRKTTKPTYYNAKVKARVVISDDTEAALILLPAGIKNTAAQYLQQFLDNQSRNKEYEDLLDAFAAKQDENSFFASMELEALFVGFNSFKSSLLGSGETVFATGMQPLMMALNTGLGSLKRRKEALTYNTVHMAAAKKIGSTELTLEEKKEVASWIPVLSLY